MLLCYSCFILQVVNDVQTKETDISIGPPPAKSRKKQNRRKTLKLYKCASCPFQSEDLEVVRYEFYSVLINILLISFGYFILVYMYVFI